MRQEKRSINHPDQLHRRIDSNRRDGCGDMQQMAAAAGYGHYEISAYAQPKRAACHNLNYWQFGDCFSIGVGAHPRLSFPHRIVRQSRFKQPKSYGEHIAAGSAVQEEVEIARGELGFKFMLNALRLTVDFGVNEFSERTGLPIDRVEQALDAAEAKGLLIRDHKTIAPSPLGQRRDFWLGKFSASWRLFALYSFNLFCIRA
ncbi:MAG: hypothetical protein H7327_00950 [Herminiimonas sp.]|nr:hypothetical protein [Herminiimonas sp.]